ncbi:hypothetical protein AB0L34_24920 [Micromonospora sp. NPDC052213]|uniref:hypothetical protein n=1 Tax=Micromonospora sp. NPDC052213 TaxID=3155812 RepID=UPI003420A307
MSKHLACLRDCGLIDYRTEGRRSFYALTRPEPLDLGYQPGTDGGPRRAARPGGTEGQPV